MSVGLTKCWSTEDDHIQNDAETVKDGKGCNLKIVRREQSANMVFNPKSPHPTKKNLPVAEKMI